MLLIPGKNTNITLFNVMIFLGSIEQKVTDLITQIYFAEKSVKTFIFHGTFIFYNILLIDEWPNKEKQEKPELIII